MDDEFDITNVEGFRNSELEITHAAVIASWENAELSETYHDDILEERRVAEGVFSEVSEAASTVGASDHSFEVVGNDLIQLVDEKSPSLETIPGYDRNSQVSAAMNSLAPVGLKHFWENDFWSSMFDRSGNTIHGAYNFNRPVNMMPLEAVATSEPSNVKVAKEPAVLRGFMECVRSLQIQSWQEERDALHDRAIRRWVHLLEAWDGDVKVVSCLSESETFKEKAQILVDIFYNKAPSTLMKRCRGLARITNYFVDRGMTFPCSEDQFYSYLNVERNNNSPPSRLKGIFEALVFSRHVLGVVEFQHLIDSRRCLGACGNDHGRIIKQAIALTVRQVAKLHSILEHGEEEWDKLFSGMALYCIYARARWADAQHAEKIIYDFAEDGSLAYIETSVAVHKTARAMNLRHQFLPLVAPAMGVAGGNWGMLWKGVRDRFGLSLEYQPLMPAPDDQHRPTVRPLGSDEAGRWLRYLLQPSGAEAAMGRISSHSMKATCLSYLAKRGINLQDRRILGHHVSGEKVPLGYSRDAASRPLRVLEKVLREIKSGIFNPDSSRSGRIKKRKLEDPGSGEVVVASAYTGSKPTDDSKDADSSSDDGTGAESHVTTDSSSDTEVETSVKPKNLQRTINAPRGTELWVHTKLRTRHLTFEGYTKTFVCGRPVGVFHERSQPVSEFDAPICRQCFNSKMLDPQ